MNTQVFREYDIRGVVEKDLDEAFVAGLAQAVSAYWADRGVKQVALGMDARLSSPLFKEILKQGIISGGIDVIDIGMVPTPVMYFALFRLDLFSMVGSPSPVRTTPPITTVSRSPWARVLFTAVKSKKIREYLEKGRRVKGSGRARTYDIIPEYVNDIIARIFRPERRLKVVVDPGNGVGGRRRSRSAAVSAWM